MKLVIDIPEEEYEFCKNQWDAECLDIPTISVKNCIPLPTSERTWRFNRPQSLNERTL